jgi:hypothetical protein
MFLLVGKDQPMMPAFLTTASTGLMALTSLKVSSTLEMQVTLVGQESSPLQENQISSERVLFKKQTTKCNLRHSSLRVTIERAFAALKNMFKILDQKPFHTFPTQVKLVLACCILHNWILGWGEDEYVPDEAEVTPDGDDSGHGVE